MNNKNRPGLGGLIAHGACCGLPLLILLAATAPMLLLFGGGLAVLGGLAVWFNRAWSRQKRYRKVLAERRERSGSLSDGSPGYLLGGARESSESDGSARNGRERIRQET